MRHRIPENILYNSPQFHQKYVSLYFVMFYNNAILILLHVCIEISLTTFTVGTSVTSKTFACITVHSISACSAVQTWIAVALDYVYNKQLQFWWMKRIYNVAVQTYISHMWYDDYCCIFNSNVLLFRVCNF